MSNNNLILIIAVVAAVFLLSGGITGDIIYPRMKLPSLTTIKTAPTIQQAQFW